MYYSQCCDAPIYGEIMGTGEDAVGVCSKCGEWMPVYEEEAEPIMLSDFLPTNKLRGKNERKS